MNKEIIEILWDRIDGEFYHKILRRIIYDRRTWQQW